MWQLQMENSHKRKWTNIVPPIYNTDRLHLWHIFKFPTVDLWYFFQLLIQTFMDWKVESTYIFATAASSVEKEIIFEP